MLKERIEKLGWEICRTTSKELKYDVLSFEKKEIYNTAIRVNYDFYTRKVFYSTYCIIGRNEIPFIDLEENKLILQYIEENGK